MQSHQIVTWLGHLWTRRRGPLRVFPRSGPNQPAVHRRHGRRPGSRGSLPPRPHTGLALGVTKPHADRPRYSRGEALGWGGRLKTCPKGKRGGTPQSLSRPGAPYPDLSPHPHSEGSSRPPLGTGVKGRGPAPLRRAVSLTGRQAGQQQPGQRRRHGAASSSRPGPSRQATSPRPRALPFPWHLSQSRAAARGSPLPSLPLSFPGPVADASAVGRCAFLPFHTLALLQAGRTPAPNFRNLLQDECLSVDM